MEDIDEKDSEFYRKFYEENRVALLQYKSLRENFDRMVDTVLGKNYYNMGMDVYTCDKICCEDISLKANRTWLERLFGR